MDANLARTKKYMDAVLRLYNSVLALIRTDADAGECSTHPIGSCPIGGVGARAHPTKTVNPTAEYTNVIEQNAWGWFVDPSCLPPSSNT